MSIAAISSSLVSAVRASPSGAPVPPVSGAPALSRQAEGGGRRHELVDAMSQVLGLEGEPSKAQDQAVFRFTHALMQDLRSLDGGAGAGPGRGQAWGRREWSDLPQRIGTLATAASAAAPAPTETQASAAPVPAPSPAPAPAPTVARATPANVPVAPALAAEPAAAELPLQPNPVTTTSAAVHLMQVPTSRLLEAFAALRRVLADQAEPATPSASRADLASLLSRLTDELDASAAAELPAGSVLKLTA